MTLAPSTTRGGTAGVNRFTPDQLLRTARLFASDPDLERHVDLTATERQWTVLDSTPHLQIWLLTWPEGTGTGWHDHVESAGAFLTVRGHARSAPGTCTTSPTPAWAPRCRSTSTPHG
jgi:hypothetical protein